MKVLVTDGDNRATLAITRALGRLGHQVMVGDKTRTAIAQASRYCHLAVQYPDPVHDAEGFVTAVAALAREHRVDVVLPVADITTFLVTGHREQFACAVPCADADVVAKAANKVDIVRIAEQIGVPVPASVVVEHPRVMPPIAHLGFPVVIKPWQSRIRTAAGWASTGVSYADTPEELESDLAARPAHEFPVLLQERLVGPGVGVFACIHDGRPVATFSHRRLRERPPWGGVSVLCESAEVDAAAGEYAARLLAAIGWQGVAMVEFKRDLRDGVPRLMEINGRFWGSLQLAIDAGVNFPALLMQTITGEPFAPQPPYRVGIRERWLWGDVDALLVTLRPGRNAARLAGRSRLRAIADFLEFRAADLHYDNPKWDDRAPFVAETRSWFRKLAAGAARASVPVAALMGASPVALAPAGSIVAPPVPVAVPVERPVPASRPAIRVRTVSSFAQVGLDQAGWNALVASGDTNSVFQTHQWARSWWESYGEGRQLLFLLAEDDHATRGVLPLVVDRGPARERVVRFIGDGRADYSDVLAPRGEPALVEALVETLLASKQWDRLDLHNIPERSPLTAIVQRCCERAGFPVVIDDSTVCPTLLVDGDGGEARRIFDKPSLRRRQNYFERTGALAVRHLTSADEIAPLLDTFFAQHVSRWAGASHPSLFVKEQNRAFYRSLTRNLADSPWLLFTVVEHDGQPLALHYGFDYDGVVTWYKPSFNPAFSAHSPGLVLLRALIGHAIDGERRELDFTWGDEPFKARFTNHLRRTIRIQVFHDTVRYTLDRANRSLRAVVRRAAGS